MPTSPSQLLLFPLLLLLVTTTAAFTNAKITAPAAALEACPGPAPDPTPWPEQFHAVLISNQTASGGRLRAIDVYYDWPHGRDLNIIRDQLSNDLLWNVEWVNGTSYLFDSTSCSTIHFDVGILPPDWKASAAYLGRDRVDGFDCHVWSNLLFDRYYDDVATGRPVSWVSAASKGVPQHVLIFETGAVLKDSSKWQAPDYCFTGSNANATISTRMAIGSRSDRSYQAMYCASSSSSLPSTKHQMFFARCPRPHLLPSSTAYLLSSPPPPSSVLDPSTVSHYPRAASLNDPPQQPPLLHVGWCASPPHNTLLSPTL